MGKISENKLKMLYILQALKERSDEDHRLGAPELSAEIEAHGLTVDRKTIYDDIETLREAGIDIEYSKEKPAGYYLAERNFDLAELKLLVDVVQSAKLITDKKTKQLIDKLSAQASEPQSKQLKNKAYVFNRAKTPNEDIFYNVDRVHSAMSQDRRISFKYYRWNTDKKLEARNGGRKVAVSPWAMTWDDENYYMIAFDEAESCIKFYRVDKMKYIDILDEPRQGQDEWVKFDAPNFATRTFNMWGEDPCKVELECENSLIGPILDRFGTDVIIVPEGSDKFRVTVEICVSRHFFGWLVSLGEGIRIRGPQNVVDAYRAHLERMLANI